MDGCRRRDHEYIDRHPTKITLVAVSSARVLDQHHVDGAVRLVQCIFGLARKTLGPALWRGAVVPSQPAVFLRFDPRALYGCGRVADRGSFYRHDGQSTDVVVNEVADESHKRPLPTASRET